MSHIVYNVKTNLVTLFTMCGLVKGLIIASIKRLVSNIIT